MTGGAVIFLFFYFFFHCLSLCLDNAGIVSAFPPSEAMSMQCLPPYQGSSFATHYGSSADQILFGFAVGQKIQRHLLAAMGVWGEAGGVGKRGVCGLDQ